MVIKSEIFSMGNLKRKRKTLIYLSVYELQTHNSKTNLVHSFELTLGIELNLTRDTRTSDDSNILSNYGSRWKGT